MFTGIVEEVGTVRATRPRLEVACRAVLGDSDVGASVSVNGVCLTVARRTGDSFAFDLSEETLARTNLGALQAGHAVNLERPVTLVTRLGGHIVQGHVDGVGRVEGMRPEEGGATMTIRVPEGLARYLVEKGSVAVDGVSLTVATLDGDAFSAALIPHTLESTTLGARAPGDPVNIEVDLIAKHVERLVWKPGGDRG